MPLDVLNIDHLSFNVRFPHQRPEWHSLAPRLGQLVREQLPSVCEQACAVTLGVDPGVYAIDRLEIELTLDGKTLTDQAFLSQLSRAIASKTRDVLAQTPPGVSITRFPGESHFLAEFLGDLLRGQAWDKWYHGAFISLRSLPTGQILTRILIEGKSRAHEVLVLLAQSGHLESLLVDLTDEQANTVVQRCLLSEVPELSIRGVRSAWTNAISSLLQRSRPSQLWSWGFGKAALWVYLSLLKYRPDLGPDSNLAQFVDDLFRIRQAAAGLADPSKVITLLNGGEEREALRLLEPHTSAQAVTTLAALLREVAPQEVARLFEMMLGAQRTKPLSERVLDRFPEFSGNTRLEALVHEFITLMRTLNDASAQEASLAFLAMGDLQNASDWLRQHAAAEQNPVNRLLNVLDILRQEFHGTELAEIAHAIMAEQEASSVEAAEEATSATSLFGGIFLLMPALVRLDIYTWLEQCPYPEPEGLPPQKTNLILYLIGLQALGKRWAQQGIYDAGLAWFAGLNSGISRKVLNAYARQIKPSMHHIFLRKLGEHMCTLGLSNGSEPDALVKGLGTDRLRSFRLSQGEEPVLDSRALDAMLSVLTAVVVREFTRALRGFESSSPEYVRRNFLLAPAQMEHDIHQLHVHFERCPLEIVLRLSGFDQEKPNVPWLDSKQLAFSFAD